MATTFYLRDITDSTGYTEKSTDTANKTASDSGTLKRLSGTIGATAVLAPEITNTVTTEEFWFHRAFATVPLRAQSISAGTWDIRTTPLESNAGLNHFARYYCYVLRAGANNATIFAPAEEATEDSTTAYIGRIHTVSGNAVTLVSGDQIVLEVWSRGTATMTTGWTEDFDYNGSTEIADETSTISNPGPKLIAPQDIGEELPGDRPRGYVPERAFPPRRSAVHAYWQSVIFAVPEEAPELPVELRPRLLPDRAPRLLARAAASAYTITLPDKRPWYCIPQDEKGICAGASMGI